MNKISGLTVLLGDKPRTYAVGREISEIVYVGSQFENGIDHIYQMFDHDRKILVEVINCPVIVDFIQE